LVKYCHPFWRYDGNRGLSPTDGVSILGIEDENSPLIPKSYRNNKQYGIITTGFLDRIDLYSTAHGLPAFLLKGMDDYRVNYENLRTKWDPLHIIKGMDLAPDIMPEEGRRGRDLFAIAHVFKYIARIGNNYYFDPEQDHLNYKIKPDRSYKLASGRANAAEAFSHKTEWLNLVEDKIDDDVSKMGNLTAIEKLENGIIERKREIATRNLDESNRKQLEREIQALVAYQNELR